MPPKEGHLYGVNGAGVIQDFVAYVLDYDKESQMATIQVRNHFTCGTKMEVLSPTIDNETFVVEELFTLDGEKIDVAKQPMQVLKTKIPFVVEKEDMIRKYRGGSCQ